MTAPSIVKKLFDSLADLEGSIILARKSFGQGENYPNEAILKRIEYYEEVLNKQKKLAQSLCNHIATENWREVTRHIKLINGLSAMIHDDARELVGTILSTSHSLITDLFQSESTN